MAEGKELKYRPIPERFISRIKSQYPQYDCDTWLRSMDNIAESSVRLNVRKNMALFEKSDPVLWSAYGRHLIDRPLYAADPLYHGGAYYPQESSSMILEWVLAQLPLEPSRIDALDVAAAPGGKSLILADFLRDRGRLISNEIDARRCAILEENISRWGCNNVLITRGSSAQLQHLPLQFQIVLLDAPCSGEGMFRKDFHARAQWSEELVASCARLQYKILDDTSHLVAPNGFLIYSTCTFSEEENLQQLDRLCGSGEFESMTLEPPEDWGIVRRTGACSSVLQFLPGKVRGEGLTLGVLKKIGNNNKKHFKSQNHYREILPSERKKLPMVNAEMVYQEKGQLFSFSKFNVEELNQIQSLVPIRKPGILAGHFVGDGFIPDHDLSMAPEFHTSFPSIQVDEITARRFLGGETWPLEIAPGWYRIEYKNVSLGWIKSVGHRINNHLPKSLRLRSRELKDLR